MKKLFFGLILMGLLVWAFFNFGLCSENIKQETLSKDNKYKIIVYECDCGATTSISYKFYIQKTFFSFKELFCVLDDAENFEVSFLDEKTIFLKTNAIDLFHFKNQVKGFEVKRGPL